MEDMAIGGEVYQGQSNIQLAQHSAHESRSNEGEWLIAAADNGEYHGTVVKEQEYRALSFLCV